MSGRLHFCRMINPRGSNCGKCQRPRWFMGQLPRGDGWLYELKFDGNCALIVKDGVDLDIGSRNDKDVTAMYPRLSAAG